MSNKSDKVKELKGKLREARKEIDYYILEREHDTNHTIALERVVKRLLSGWMVEPGGTVLGQDGWRKEAPRWRHLSGETGGVQEQMTPEEEKIVERFLPGME